MKLRCDLHLNEDHRRLLLAAEREETLEHLALKLSAFLLFWGQNPKVAPSLQHPALLGQEFRPDLMGLNATGEIALWVECGTITLHKLNKLTRRHPSARLVVIKASETAARRLRADATDQVDRHARLEIWAWPTEPFLVWLRALAETVTVVGEARGRSLNLVINDVPLVTDILAF